MSSVSVAQASAKGTLTLFFGNLVSTILSMAAIIVFARLLGPDGYGIYTLAFVVPSILQLFVGLGVSTAVTRYVAFSLSSGDVERAASMTRAALLFYLLFGLAFSGLDLFVAPYFVVTFLHRPELVQYSVVASIFVLATTVSQCALAALLGWGSMFRVSAFTVLQSAIKLVGGVGLILAGFGVYGAVTSHMASYLIEGFIAAIMVYLGCLRSSPQSFNRLVDDVRTMVRYGAPLFTGNVVSGLASQYATVVLAAVVTNAVIGYYQAAVNVTVAITVISGAMANVLLRSFAELHGLAEDIALAFQYAVKYVSLILTPIVFFILAAAGPLFNIFYGPAYSGGIVLLKLVAVSYLPVSIGLTVLPSYLNGIGKSRFTMWISISGALALVLASALFVLYLGLGAEGIVLALLASNLFIVVPGLALCVKYLNIRLAMRPLAGIFLAGLASWMAVVLLPVGGLAAIWKLVVDAAIYIAVCATLVPMFYGVDEDDIIRISVATDTMGPLKVVFAAFLGLERKILQLRNGGTERAKGSSL